MSPFDATDGPIAFAIASTTIASTLPRASALAAIRARDAVGRHQHLVPQPCRGEGLRGTRVSAVALATGGALGPELRELGTGLRRGLGRLLGPSPRRLQPRGERSVPIAIALREPDDDGLGGFAWQVHHSPIESQFTS